MRLRSSYSLHNKAEGMQHLQEKRGGGGYPACDALAAAVAVEPACCLQSVSRVCLVDCAGTPGSSIFHTGSESISNVDLVTKLDLPRIQTLLQDSLR